jgi:hypothetical protein
MKLTRKQIKEGLESVPMDTLLLGASATKTTKLTAKQLEFAREVAQGQPKARAYKKAYNAKGKPSTNSKNAQNLLKNKSIQTQIDAFKVAFEAMKYQTPAHLRTLVIHKLTEKALDEEVPPAQQLKALELLGKITEVALFTERREVVQSVSSEQVREKLIKSLSLAIKSSGAKDVSDTSAEELLRELSGKQSDNVIEGEIMSVNDALADAHEKNVDGEGVFDGDSVHPTTGATPFLGNADSSPLHSIPHTQSPAVSLTPVRHRVNPNVTKGEGGEENMVDSLLADLGKAPQGKDGSHG